VLSSIRPARARHSRTRIAHGTAAWLTRGEREGKS